MSVAWKTFECCIILCFMVLLLHKQDTENLGQKGVVTYIPRTMIVIFMPFTCWGNMG